MTDKQHENKEQLDQQELRDKKVAFYDTFIKAWVENRMETDKQLLTLSSLGIGLLMVFRPLPTVTAFILWLGAGVAFLITILMILFIFRNNSKYIEYLIQDSNEKQVEKSLHTLTTGAFYMFIIGIVLTFSLAIAESGFNISKI